MNAPTPEKFTHAFTAFFEEMFDHQEKGDEWETHDVLFHVERGLKHLANASLWLKAGRTADAKEDILHAMSRAIFAVELYRRAHPAEET